jgi:zinc protease
LILTIDFKPNKVVELKDDAIQSAIRIGRPLVTKTHKDYQALQVVNTIFGGYFGSRLMSNIREDKGYTYGIGSGVVSMNDVGYFVISTEVGVDVCASALNEIYFELKRLREELVSDDELDLVKNYMLGTLLRSAEGAFCYG